MLKKGYDCLSVWQLDDSLPMWHALFKLSSIYSVIFELKSTFSCYLSFLELTIINTIDCF